MVEVLIAVMSGVGLKPTERLRTSYGRRCKGQRKDHSSERTERFAQKGLTEPTLLEMFGNRVTPAVSGCG